MVKCVSESHSDEIFVDNPVVSRDTNKSCNSGGDQQPLLFLMLFVGLFGL